MGDHPCRKTEKNTGNANHLEGMAVSSGPGEPVGKCENRTASGKGYAGVIGEGRVSVKETVRLPLLFLFVMYTLTGHHAG